MLRRDFLAAATGAAGAGMAAAQPPSRPNIIFILADDLGFGDVGCYGQTKFATPRLDQMAEQGMRFNQAYSGSPVCAPARCTLMTGLHTGHCRVRGNHNPKGERVSLRPDDRTVGEVLHQAGYRTGVIGKWGIGEAGTRGVPNEQGFDEWFGFLNQDHALDYYPRHLWHNDREFFPPGNQGAKQEQYVQELFTQRALEFIEENSARPFFLYLAYTVPHASSERGRDTGDGFVVPSYAPYQDRDWPDPEKGFAAMVHMLDRDTGRILDLLKRLGIDSNTLVVFSSDNGPALDSGHTPEFFNSHGPLRGRKGDVYEGGIRVPAIARWPGMISAGQTSGHVWAFWDFLPTAAELAGLAVPSGIDGVSFAPVLLGKQQREPAYLYWEHHSRGFHQAIRSGQWKAVRHGRAPLELYNLETDIHEASDLALRNPDVAKRLDGLMARARVDSPDYPVER